MTESDGNFAESRRLVDPDPYTAVVSKRVSQEVVDRIRGLIVSDRLRPGDRLPSERTLAAYMGVGRVTIREAMRILEANGLVEIRVGARGGAVVTSPSLSRIGAGLAELIRVASATPSEIMVAMRAFEVGIIPIVVERITDQEVASLRDMTIYHRAVSPTGWCRLDMSTTFHVQVAKCAHNRAIEALARSLRRRHATPPGQASVAMVPMARCDATEHGDVVDAIAARDPVLAKEIMRTHLDRTVETRE